MIYTQKGFTPLEMKISNGASKKSQTHRGRARRSQAGFTLIELLVVIAVIAILMAILIPVLGAAKKQAQAIVCLGNQRGLILGYTAYASDHDNQIPCSDTFPPNPSDTPTSRTYARNFAWAKAPMTTSGSFKYQAGVEVTQQERFNGIKAGVLWPYCKDVKLYHCPGDNRHKVGTEYGRTHGLPLHSHTMWRSYGIQGGLYGEELTNGWSGWAIRKLSELRSPARTYVFVEEFYDGWGANYNGGSWQIEDIQEPHPSWWNVMAIWHVDSYTLSFADGHVSKFKCKDKRTIDYARDRWNTPRHQPGNPDLDFMIKGYAVPLPR